MPITVEVPNVGTIEFPPDFDTDDVRSALAQKFPDFSQAKRPAPITTAPTTSVISPQQRQRIIAPTPGPGLGDIARGAASTIKDFADQPPLINLTPQISPQDVARQSPMMRTALGASKGITDFASGLTSPLNLALIAGTGGLGKAMGPVVKKSIAALFAADMGHQTYNAVADILKMPPEERTAQNVAEKATTAILSGGMTALMVKEALSKHPAAALPKAAKEVAAIQPKTAGTPAPATPTEATAAGAATPVAPEAPAPQPAPVKQAEMTFAPEHKAIVDQTASENGDKVVYEAPTDPNDPFAKQIASADRKRGVIRINPQELSKWLGKDVPKGKDAEAIASLLSEERIHLSTTDSAAQAYHDSLTPVEQAFGRGIYTGKWGQAMTPVQLGHEMLRMRLQQLARMNVRETLERSNRERWKVKSLLAANDAIRGVREALGTKASAQGLAILDRIQGNLDAAIKANGGGEQGAQRKDLDDDKAEYDRIGAEMQALPGGMDNPRFQELWKQREAVKNRHRGYVPGTEPEEPGATRKSRDESQQDFFLPPVPKEAEVERPTAAELADLKEESLTADQVDTKEENAYQRIPPEALNDPYTLGRTLTESAARTTGANRTATNRLTVLEKPGRTGVEVVSTYRDPGTGRAMLAHPDLSGDRTRIHRTLPKVLADGWRPVASVLLKEPVSNYRRHFPTMDAFEQATGFPKGQTANLPTEVGFENQKPIPIAQPSSADEEYVSDEARESVFNHFAKAKSIGKAVTDIASLPNREARTIRGVFKKALDMMGDMTVAERKQAMKEFLRKIYEQAKAKDKAGFLGQFERPERAAITEGHGQGEPGMGKEIPGGDEARREVSDESEPAAIRKHAEEEYELAKENFKSAVSGRITTQAAAAAFDNASNTPNNLGRQAETFVRAAASSKPASKIAAHFLDWRRGQKQVLSAANALVEAGAIFKDGTFMNSAKVKIPFFKQQVAKGLAEAQKLAADPSPRKARLGRAWARNQHELMAELDYAEKNWDNPDLQETARRMKQQADAIWLRMNNAGFDVRKDLNHLPHRYDAELWDGDSFLFKLLKGSEEILGKRFRDLKTYPTYYDASADGPFIAATRDGASLVGHMVRQGETMIARQALNEAWKAIKMPDGRAMAVDPIKKPDETWGSPSLDYKYVPTAGKGIAVHKDFAPTIRNLIEPSKFNEDWAWSGRALRFEQLLKHNMLLGDFFHLGKMIYRGTSLRGKDMGFTAGQSILDIADRNMDDAVKRGIISQREVDWSREKVKYGSGEITRRDLIEKAYQKMGANLGKIQDALYKDLITDLTPSAGPIRRGIHRVLDPTTGRYNRFLFDALTRGLMSESIATEFEKQSKSHPDANPDALLRDISKDVNIFFGNLGKQGLLKSATHQDIARAVFLAPGWVESLITKDAVAASRLSGISKLTGARQGLSPVGTIGSGVGKGLLFMFGLAQAINLLTRRQFTWQNDEEGRKLDAWLPSMDGPGIWFRPGSMFAEIADDAYHKAMTRPNFLDVAASIAGNKTSPMAQAGTILAFGVSPTGEKLTSASARIGSASKELVPIPLSFGKAAQGMAHAIAPSHFSPPPRGDVYRQAMASLGTHVDTAKDPAQRIYRMAEDFLAQHNLKPETGWEERPTDQASYSKLRAALQNDNEKEAKHQYEELLDTHTPRQIFAAMKNAKKRPFTGSRDHEKKFILSLDDKGLDLYTKAQEQRESEYQKWLDFAVQQP